MAQKTKNKPSVPEVKSHSKKHHTLLIIVGAGLLLLGTLVSSIIWYYKDRALPNVMVASVAVGGKTKDEIKSITEAQKSAITLSFENEGQKTDVGLVDLGVTIDIDKTVEQTIQARRNWLDLFLPWQSTNVPLSYNSDLGIAKEFAKQHFPAVVTDPKDAEVVFNGQSNKFDVKPGEPGKGFDALAFVQAVEQLAIEPQSVILPVTTTPVQPVIQAKELEPVAEEVNKVSTLAIKFIYKGKEIYSASPADIASWTQFTPEPTKSTVEVSYDEAKIKQFLEQKVGASIATRPVDQKVIRNPNTGNEVVIQSGREGRQLDEIDKLVKDVLGAVENNSALHKDVAVVTAPFKTVTVAGSDRWIEVDLSEQRTYLYLGNERIASFLISSGVANHPSPVGEFAIGHKNASQSMSGGSKASGSYYYLPGVTWVSFFYRDYAFHTAYWHNNFGHPMSHGCINMKAADAKALYDFAPTGTRVIVHS